MNKREEDSRKRLLSTFRIEAQDHLKTISSVLLGLEISRPREEEMELIETIFRASHTLKGASRTVNMKYIEAICQPLEDIFDVWKYEGIKRSPEIFDTIYHAVDLIGRLLSSLKGDRPQVDSEEISKAVQDLSEAAKGAVSLLTPALSSTVRDTSPTLTGGGTGDRYRAIKNSPEPVRIPAEKINALLQKTGEMLPIKLFTKQHSMEIKDLAEMFELFSRKMHKVSTADTSLEWIDLNLNAIKSRLNTLKKSSWKSNIYFSRVVDNLLDEAKNAMLQPFSVITESFPMLVRSVSHEQGKEVKLIIQGEEVEIDRRILEGIKDPLIHIIRNCVDHGIERPDAREAEKKVPHGTVTVQISHTDSGKVELKISDDGRGMDSAQILETAVSTGVISQVKADSLGEDEALELIFLSGFSTSPLITTISGRGLGLAIVREKVENLNGTVSVKSHLNKGTEFSLIVPVTVATFRGIQVRVNDKVFIIPSVNVVSVDRVRKDDIKTVENRASIALKGHPVSFVLLKDLLQLPAGKRGRDNQDFVTVVVLTGMNMRIAAGIDEVISEEEVLVKNLGKQLLRVKNVSGVAVLGTGKAVPVLNVQDLIRTSLKNPVSPPVSPVSPVSTDKSKEDETAIKSILVVEDSITSRILLKNILESAGYYVRTAVDGMDAITMLKTGDFDLVVSDIEMPRVNGFVLTSRMRGDQRLAEIPVVLVTALETREDRETGIEAGANAYIVKSSFDQSNLLEVVKRLI